MTEEDRWPPLWNEFGCGVAFGIYAKKMAIDAFFPFCASVQVLPYIWAAAVLAHVMLQPG